MSICVGFGSACIIGGVVGLCYCAYSLDDLKRIISELDDSEWKYYIIFATILAAGLCFTSLGIYFLGSSSIVFDEHTESIYMEHLRCCYKKATSIDLGPFSDFKECVLKEEMVRDNESGQSTPHGTTHTAIMLIFTDGSKVLGETENYGKEEKERYDARNMLGPLVTNTRLCIKSHKLFDKESCYIVIFFLCWILIANRKASL